MLRCRWKLKGRHTFSAGKQYGKGIRGVQRMDVLIMRPGSEAASMLSALCRNVSTGVIDDGYSGGGVRRLLRRISARRQVVLLKRNSSGKLFCQRSSAGSRFSGVVIKRPRDFRLHGRNNGLVNV